MVPVNGLSVPACSVELLTPAIEEEWDQLARRCGAPAFLGPGYLDVWRRTFAPQKPIRVMTARRDGSLVCAVPLAGTYTVGPPGNSETPVQGVVADTPQDAQELISCLMGLRAPVVEFACLPDDGTDYALVQQQAQEHRRNVRTTPVVRIPVVDTEGGWEAYWHSRSRNLRRNVRRLQRRTQERGEVSTVVYTSFGEGERERLLDIGFAVEGSGWKGREGTSLERDAKLGGHYRDLCKWAQDIDALALFFVRIGDEDIAFGLGIVTARTLYALKIGYAGHVPELSPGLLLLHHMIHWTFESGLDRFDFAGHDEPYKAAWATGYQHQHRVSAFARGPRGYLARASQHISRRVRQLRGALAVRRRRE